VPVRLKATVQSGGIRRGDRVSDVGTGTGILIFFMRKFRPSEIHACDLAESMLARVRQKYPGVITHQCDISDLRLPEDSPDAVFINGCLSNIPDKSKTLDNLYRMIRTGGRPVISHPPGRAFIVELQKHAPPLP
jgi:ubiquinone/menaquinone biosynthesis C-methylase UbiE